MAEFYQTQEQLEDIFGDLLEMMTGLKSKDVLASYPAMGGIPFGHKETKLYYTISPSGSPISQWKNRTDSTHQSLINRSSQYTRELELRLVIYGRNAVDIATRLLHDFTTQTIREQLTKQKIYYIPDKSIGPMRLPESRNGQWYERCDLSLYFYNSIVEDEKLNTFGRVIVGYKNEGK